MNKVISIVHPDNDDERCLAYLKEKGELGPGATLGDADHYYQEGLHSDCVGCEWYDECPVIWGKGERNG